MKTSAVRALAKAVLAYHAQLVEIAKDRVHGSMVKDAKLDALYRQMVYKARAVIAELDDN